VSWQSALPTAEEITVLIRRNFLNTAVAAIALPAIPRICNAQVSQGGPQLTQLLRADLERQGQTVQETVVNLLEIIFVLDGNLVVEIEGKGPREVTAGAIALISAETPHLVRNGTQARARALVTHSRAEKEKPFLVILKKSV
jgi:glyoxylate utilization-related uncharacterized protein